MMIELEDIAAANCDVDVDVDIILYITYIQI